MPKAMSASSEDSALNLIQQNALRTLEFLHAQRRDLSQRSIDFAAEEERLSQRQIRIAEISKNLSVREEELKRDLEQLKLRSKQAEERERMLCEQSLKLVRYLVERSSIHHLSCHTLRNMYQWEIR